MSRDFGIAIANRLNDASYIAAHDIALYVLDMAETNADFPERWPLVLVVEEEGVKDMVECPRTFSTLSGILDGYGLSVYMGQDDFIMIDVISLTEEDDPSYFFEASTVSDIPGADDMHDLSKKSVKNKLVEAYDIISDKIHDNASNGEFKIIIDVVNKPFNSNFGIIKRFFRRMISRGYKVDENGVKLSEGAKIDLVKHRKITVTW